MRKQVVRICMLLACAFGFMQGQASIQPSIVKATIDELIAKDAKNQTGITKGVEQGVCCTTSLKEEYFLEQLALNY